jgi:hypothetical protein
MPFAFCDADENKLQFGVVNFLVNRLFGGDEELPRDHFRMSDQVAVHRFEAEARAEFGDIEVPLELQPSVSRHRANLARLVGALQLAGLDDPQIEASVNAVVGSYRLELLSAIKTFVKKPDDV